jgi:hypothetical protein
MLRTSSLLAVLCACVFSTTTPAQQPSIPTVDEIVRKHVDARGGLDKLKALQSVRFAGKGFTQGIEIPVVMSVKRPSSVRIESSFQGTTIVQAFDGTSGWSLNPFMGSSDPQPLAGAQLDDMKDNADFDGPLVDYKAKGNTVELVAREDLEGSAVYKLKITKADGKTEFAFLDASTLLQVKGTSSRTIQGQAATTDTFTKDYKPVKGVLFPFHVETKVNGQTMIQIVLDSGEANVPMDDGLFKMPAKTPSPAPAPALKP